MIFVDGKSWDDFATACCDLGEDSEKRLPVSINPRLVFVNGVYHEKLSQLDGIAPYCWMDKQDDVFCLVFPDDMCLAPTLIELLYVGVRGDCPQKAEAKLRVRLGHHARVTLFEQHLWMGQGEGDLALAIEKKISLGRQAKLVHVVLKKDLDRKASRTALRAQTEVLLEKGAYYDVFHASTVLEWVHEAWALYLTEELAQVRFQGAMVLEKTQEAHMAIDVHHQAPNGASQQIMKAVLKDRAKARVDGVVHVYPQAQKTDAHQLTRGLLLSEGAVMKAEPSLEIFADDVKCGHGCAIGALDEKALFYMQSRGIPEKQARFLLIQAFLTDIVETIQDAPLRALVEEQLMNDLVSFSSSD